MSAGIACLFNKTADVKTVTVTQDSMGGEVHSASTRLTKKCRIRKLNASEQVLRGAEGTVSTHRIYMDAKDTINEDDQIVIDSKTYDIDYVDDPHGMGEFLQIDATLRDNS